MSTEHDESTPDALGAGDNAGENAAERAEQQTPTAPLPSDTAPTTPIDGAAQRASAPDPDPAPDLGWEPAPAAPEHPAVSVPASASEPAAHHRPWPRTGPIVWGVIVLAICLYSAVQLVAPGSIDSTTVTIAALIGLGLLLVGVSVAMLIRGRRERQEDANRAG